MAELVETDSEFLFRPHFYQRFVAESAGRDIRIVVIGGKAVAAMERLAKGGEFRSNAELGRRMSGDLSGQRIRPPRRGGGRGAGAGLLRRGFTRRPGGARSLRGQLQRLFRGNRGGDGYGHRRPGMRGISSAPCAEKTERGSARRYFFFSSLSGLFSLTV